MKTYKRIELLVNTLLILSFICVFAITQSFELLFLSYFIVGGIQLLSMLVHIYRGWFSNHNFRFVYYIVLITVGLLCIGGIGFFILLYGAPLLAAFYVFICFREWRILKFKELVHLK